MARIQQANGTWIDTDDLHPGASPSEGSYEGGISPEQAKRIADEIMADEKRYGGAPSTTPPEGTGRSGVPQGYGKWGDLA